MRQKRKELLIQEKNFQLQTVSGSRKSLNEPSKIQNKVRKHFSK